MYVFPTIVFLLFNIPCQLALTGQLLSADGTQSTGLHFFLNKDPHLDYLAQVCVLIQPE